jgi:hypothetical protein
MCTSFLACLSVYSSIPYVHVNFIFVNAYFHLFINLSFPHIFIPLCTNSYALSAPTHHVHATHWPQLDALTKPPTNNCDRHTYKFVTYNCRHCFDWLHSLLGEIWCYTTWLSPLYIHLTGRHAPSGLGTWTEQLRVFGQTNTGYTGYLCFIYLFVLVFVYLVT